MVEYTPGYLADYLCEKRHIPLRIAGGLEPELADGRVFALRPGMSHQMLDGAEPHRSRAPGGMKLSIVD